MSVRSGLDGDVERTGTGEPTDRPYGSAPELDDRELAIDDVSQKREGFRVTDRCRQGELDGWRSEMFIFLVEEAEGDLVQLAALIGEVVPVEGRDGGSVVNAHVERFGE